MKRMHAGGRKVIQGPLQTEAQTGRQDQNRSAKADFKSGAQDARTTDGVVTVGPGRGLMRSPAAKAESKRAAVKRG